MKNIKWCAAIVIAFLSGYFAHAGQSKVTASNGGLAAASNLGQSSVPEQCDESAEQLSTAHAHSNASVPSTVFSNVVAIQSRSSTSSHAGNAHEDLQKSTLMPEKAAEQKSQRSGSQEISDAEIDKILPAPFNETIKNNHGPDRALYKQFAEAPEPSNWDSSMQNKLSDAILSNPNASAISVDSITCKGNICEVRIVEHKDGAWQLIMAEMRIQSWWDFGANSSYGFAMMQNAQLVTGNLTLFVRK